jgi:hypothetical protein
MAPLHQHNFNAMRAAGGAAKGGGVMKQFSVSLVFQRQTEDRMLTALRVTHVEANSEDEALGKGIKYLWAEEELKNYVLLMRAVLRITTD